jgi:predicted component of type VI protein secretion system
MLEEMKNRVGSGEGVDPTSLLAMFEKLRAELISPEPSTQTPRVSNGDENEDDEDVDLFVDNSPRSAPPKLHEQQPKQPVLFAKPSVPLKSAIKKPKPERGAPKLPKVKSVAASALTAQFLAVGSPAKKQPAPAEQRVVLFVKCYLHRLCLRI